MDVENAVTAGKRLVAEERERRTRAAQRAKLIRRTVLATLLLTALALAGLLAVLNRRRKRAMLEAQRKLGEREGSVGSETDNIDVLFERNDEILGNRERLQKRGYEGLTRQLSEQALNYVDDLFIMSKEVRRVLGEARELVYPSSIYGKLVNLFSNSRYQQAVNLVTGKPLRFTKLNGLPHVLHDRVKLNPDGTVPDEITMTFEDVYKAFEQRGDDAESSLNTIEHCLTEIHDTLNARQQDLEQAAAQEKELALAAEQDHYFSLPNYFEKLLPSVQADLAEADKLSAFDAVQAMQTPIPAATRKMTEAAALAGHLTKAQQELFPQLTAATEKINARGYASNWVDDELRAIGEDADRLMGNRPANRASPMKRRRSRRVWLNWGPKPSKVPALHPKSMKNCYPIWKH